MIAWHGIHLVKHVMMLVSMLHSNPAINHNRALSQQLTRVAQKLVVTSVI